MVFVLLRLITAQQAEMKITEGRDEEKMKTIKYCHFITSLTNSSHFVLLQLTLYLKGFQNSFF